MNEMHTELCPGCQHRMSLHAREVGCVHGWTYDIEGRALTDGCECPLTLADEHQPPSERDVEWDPADD